MKRFVFLFILAVSLILLPLFMIEAAVTEVTQQHLVVSTFEENVVGSAELAEWPEASAYLEADLFILSAWMNHPFNYYNNAEEGAASLQGTNYTVEGPEALLYNDAGGGFVTGDILILAK